MGIRKLTLAWLGVLASINVAASLTVDLGYTIQQASLETSINGFRYLNFTNIRYAASPTGRNRFQPPVAPKSNRSIQNAGQYSIMCPQAQPGWLSFYGQSVGNLTEVPAVTVGDLAAVGPGTDEDCLFLDVLVPENVFQKKNGKAPVLLFLHGGGFVQGSKSEYGPGIGLEEVAAENGHDLIYISINYRLGLFGWLSGPELTPNMGLRDQEFALEWVKKYIHLFGGNSNAVTIMGESAGGGSIMYHLTSSTASSRSLFQRAIVQSPFTFNIPSTQQKSTFDQVLQTANVSSFSDLKHLSTQKLQTINGLVVGNAQPYGTFAFGPVTEQPHFPEYPPVLLAKAQYDHSVSLMTGHNSDEGSLFASPFIRDNSDYADFLQSLLPGIPRSALSTLTQYLYPNDLSGQQGYVDQLGRVKMTIAEALIVCNAYSLDTAFEPKNDSFAYEFTVPPGLHAGDLPYTFLDPEEPESGVNITLARLMQTYFTNFAATGSPNSGILPVPSFPKISGLTVENFNITMFGPMRDNIPVDRCDWWQRGLFRPPK